MKMRLTSRQASLRIPRPKIGVLKCTARTEIFLKGQEDE